jgi:hypothetical protein
VASINNGSWLSTERPPSDDGHTSCWRQIIAESTGNFQTPLLPFQSPQPTEASVFQSSSLHLSSDSLSNTLYLVTYGFARRDVRSLSSSPAASTTPPNPWSSVHLAKDSPPMPAPLDSTLCPELCDRQWVYARWCMPIVECKTNLPNIPLLPETPTIRRRLLFRPALRYYQRSSLTSSLKHAGNENGK